MKLNSSLFWAWDLSAFEIFIQWLLELAFFEPHCMLVNACNVDLTFYYKLSLTSTDIIFGANAIKSILQKRKKKKAEINP